MAQLFNRAVKVIITPPIVLSAPILIEGLRVQFKIKKTVSKEPNECELSIYNLSADTRAALQRKGIRIIVEAGYRGDAALANTLIADRSQLPTTQVVFDGDSRVIDHVHEGPDWITKVQCGDGERAYQFAHFAESFGPGTSLVDVFKKGAAAIGTKGVGFQGAVKQVTSELLGQQFTQGFSVSGKALPEMSRMLEGYGLELSIQDGQLQVTRTGGTTQDQSVLLSAETGLVGSPEHGSPAAADPTQGKKKKPQVLKAKTLLQPRLRAGGRVRIESLNISGDFKILTVTHDGDTSTGPWYSEIEALPL